MMDVKHQVVESNYWVSAFAGYLHNPTYNHGTYNFSYSEYQPYWEAIQYLIGPHHVPRTTWICTPQLNLVLALW